MIFNKEMGSFSMQMALFMKASFPEGNPAEKESTNTNLSNMTILSNIAEVGKQPSLMELAERHTTTETRIRVNFQRANVLVKEHTGLTKSTNTWENGSTTVSGVKENSTKMMKYFSKATLRKD